MAISRFDVELTDTFGGEANYSWVKRATVSVPELTHYGYDGAQGYAKADRAQHRQLMRKAKAAMGLTGARGRREDWGDAIAFYPYGAAKVMFITFRE